MPLLQNNKWGPFTYDPHVEKFFHGKQLQILISLCSRQGGLRLKIISWILSFAQKYRVVKEGEIRSNSTTILTNYGEHNFNLPVTADRRGYVFQTMVWQRNGSALKRVTTPICFPSWTAVTSHPVTHLCVFQSSSWFFPQRHTIWLAAMLVLLLCTEQEDAQAEDSKIETSFTSSFQLWITPQAVFLNNTPFRNTPVQQKAKPLKERTLVVTE